MNKILYAGSEVMPFGATGGLGDVLGSLPAAVKQKNPDCDVRVVMPLYSQIKKEWRRKMKLVGEMNVSLAWRDLYCGIYSLKKDDVTFYFLDNEYYFAREALYGAYDDAERFAFFSVAVLELMREIDFYPDIYHANDWQTALSVIKLKCQYWNRPEYEKIKAVYTANGVRFECLPMGAEGLETAALAATAAVRQGTTQIVNAARLRIKESDRLAAVAQVLNAMGAQVTELPDGLVIVGQEALAGGVAIDSYNDHRIAMMAAVAATRCEKPVTVLGAECVNKSYPAFWQDYRLLGGRVTEGAV